MHSEAAAVLKNFANVTGKHLCGASFLQSWKPSGLQLY